MMTKKTVLFACICAISSQHSLAAVSDAEAGKLGNELTPVGAEKAGNADGSIPAWSPNVDLKSEDPVYMTDPLKGDKPIYNITSANLDQYKSMMSAGAVRLFETHPDFRMEVYETKRTAVAPDWVGENTKKNATSTTLKDKLALQNWAPGVPFPIPQNGDEAIWNHIVRWIGKNNVSKAVSYYVDTSGSTIESSKQLVTWSSPAYSPELDWGDGSDEYILFRADFEAPARRAGEITLVRDPIDFTAGNGRKAWQYLAGQRRVKRAPSVAFDTPAPGTAGTSTYDDTYMYNGSPERYNWTLVGKQECIIPYNNWRAVTVEDHATLTTPNYFNPDYLRWEKHRCWVVEGKVKEGERHIYETRRFYLDEDTWAVVMGDMYDGRGDLWRSNFAVFATAYQTKAFWSPTTVMYDFQSKMYNLNGIPTKKSWTQLEKPEDPSYYTSNAMKRSGVR